MRAIIKQRKWIMKLRIFFVLLATVALSNMNAADIQSQKNAKLTLKNALELIESGKQLVVYYNEGEKPSTDYSKQIIKSFRKDKAEHEHVADFVMSGLFQYESTLKGAWIDRCSGMQPVLDAKLGMGHYPCGFVIYQTYGDSDWSLERYEKDLQVLKNIQVPVIVYAHDRHIAQETYRCFLVNNADKSLLINGSLSDGDISDAILTKEDIGVIGFLAVFFVLSAILGGK
jgi:hypothetical protein